ncbi:MAG: arylesterase [Granulosicoccus sp.]
MRFTYPFEKTFIVALGLALFAVQSVRADSYTALVIGDSISAAYGLDEQQGWVNLAEQSLAREGHEVTFVNASISGDTTAGGLRRLPDALERFNPDLVILELGGNDGLRGYPVNAMRDNLVKMAELAQEQGADVLILGMMIPSNYGQAYLKMFAQAFVDAAEATNSAFIPFLLEPIAQNREFFQADGIHPTAEAQPLMVEHVMPELLEILESAEALE